MRFISCPKGAERKEQYKKKMQVPTSNDKQEIPGLAPDDGFVPGVSGVKPTSHTSVATLLLLLTVLFIFHAATRPIFYRRVFFTKKMYQSCPYIPFN